MNMRYFGDSYDLVKRSFLSWLRDLGSWYIQPMFTHEVTALEAERYASLLGGEVVSHAELRRDTDRAEFFASSRGTKNLLLDPDIGIRAEATGRKAPCYVTYRELAELVRARPKYLTLVYDQCVPRAKDEVRRDWLRDKLEAIRAQGICGLYYVSHAPMLVASRTREVLGAARASLLEHLPEGRLLC